MATAAELLLRQQAEYMEMIKEFSTAKPPPHSFIPNSWGNDDLLVFNFTFQQKTMGKRAANFVCRGKGCSASASFTTRRIEDSDEYEVDTGLDGNTRKFSHLNLIHKTGPNGKT